MNNTRQWWALRGAVKYGPCISREIAAQKLFDQFPKIKDALTGYGAFGPSFDIQWITRDEVQR